MMSDLPKGWKETRLDEIVDITSSKRIFYSEYVDFGIAFYRSKEIIEKQKGNSISTELFITKEKYNEIKNNFGVPVKDDLLLTSVGTLGIPYLVKENEIFYFKDGNLTWFRNYKGLEPEFLYFYILSPVGKKRLNEMTIGSTQSALTISGLKKLKLELPPLDEQKQIANILSSFDKKIELLKEQNQTLETMAQTIFKEWFVDFNYPNATGEMIDSEMGEIPKGWKIIQISNLFDVRDGTHDSPKQTLRGKYLITSKHILNFKLDMENAYLISEEDFLNINKRSLVEENDILFSMIGTIGLTYLEQSSNINYAIKNVALFKTSQNIEWVYYMYIWLSGGKGQDFILKHKTGSTQQYISLSSLRNIKIIKPSSEILIYFNNFVRPIFNKIKINTSQIQTLEETRDSLLPKLMSGKIRLKDFDESN